MSYTLPLGVSSPAFGIDENVDMYLDPSYTWDYGLGPEPYRTASGHPYAYYVDKSAVASTDTANPYGSPSVPRKTWPYPLAAGACVQIHGTGYTFTNGSSKMSFGGSGTSGLPIFYYGVSPDEVDMPTITLNGTTDLQGDYTILEKLKFDSNCRITTRPSLKSAPVTHVVIRDCYFRGTGTFGSTTAISASSASSGSTALLYTSDMVVLRCVISDYGDWLSSSENDATGVIYPENSKNCWVLDTEVYHMGGDGARIGADSGQTATDGHHYVGRCHLHDNRENALDIKQARYAVVSQNVFHGFHGASSDPGSAIVLHYSPQHIWLIDNDVSDANYGFSASGMTGDCYLIGNYWHDCAIVGLSIDRGGGTFWVYNDTIDDCGNGARTTGIISAVHYKNCLFTNTRTSGYAFRVDGTGVSGASTVDNCLVYGGSVQIGWGGAPTTYANLAAFQAATGKGANSISSNPLYVSGSDKHLQSGSPAIDSGADIASLNSLFAADFPTGGTILKDISLVSRPQDAGFDMGAYEYTSGGANKIILLTGDMAFGNVIVGEAAIKTLTITNTGDADLTVTSVSYPATFTGATTGFVVASGASHDIAVTFTPLVETNYSGNITVSSDATSGTNTKACSGAGVQGASPIYPRYKRAAVLSRRRPD